MNKELQTEKNRSEKLSNENLILQKTLETSISDLETKKQLESGKEISEIFDKEKIFLEEINNKNILIKNLREKISDFEIKIENFESKNICQEKQNLDFENEKNLKIDVLEKEILNLKLICKESEDRSIDENQIMKQRVSDEQIRRERHLEEQISELKLKLEDIQVRHNEMIVNMRKEHNDVMEKEKKIAREDADVALLKANSVTNVDSHALTSLQSQLGSLRQQLNK